MKHPLLQFTALGLLATTLAACCNCPQVKPEPVSYAPPRPGMENSLPGEEPAVNAAPVPTVDKSSIPQKTEPATLQTSPGALMPTKAQLPNATPASLSPSAPAPSSTGSAFDKTLATCSAEAEAKLKGVAPEALEVQANTYIVNCLQSRNYNVLVPSPTAQ